MGYPKCDFIWYELLTSDANAAQRFYGEVVGWKASDSGQSGMDYRILDAGDGQAGGLMQINEQMPGAKPIWLGYVAVPDVDAAVADWTTAGGSLQMPAIDIPNVGRIAQSGSACCSRWVTGSSRRWRAPGPENAALGASRAASRTPDAS